MKWHFWLGYGTLGMLVFRIIWGVVGPRHARFLSFLRGPKTIFRYIRGLTGVNEALSSVGHNPLGGIMVIVMLLLAAFQTGTGLFATDDIAWSGPYNAAVSASTAELLTRLHHRTFNFIWAAIGLHLAAILYYSFVKKEYLVPAMLTGCKPAQVVPAEQALVGSELWKAAIVIAVSGAVVYWVLSSAPPVSSGL